VNSYFGSSFSDQDAQRGAVGIDADISAEIDEIVLLALVRFGAAVALVILDSGAVFRVQSVAGLDLPEMTGVLPPWLDVASKEAILVVPDAQNDERFCNHPLVVGSPHLRFCAAAALTTAAGRRIATLGIYDTQPRQTFSDGDFRALSRLARQVMVQFELQRLRNVEKIGDIINTVTNNAIVAVDMHDRIIYWNRGAEVMFGWSAEEALSEQLAIILPSRHQDGHNDGMARLREEAPYRLVGKTVEVPAIMRDGRELSVELSLAEWAKQPTGIVGGYVAIIRDTSERRALQAERDAVTHRMSEQMAAIENSVDGIAVTDSEGLFTFMNDAHAAMFGFSSCAEAYGQSWRSLYSRDEVSRLEAEAFPILHRDNRFRGRTVGIRRDGTTIEQEISLSLNSSGRLVCVTRDVGPRIAAEREQNLLREQLLIAHRQEALGQIAIELAHDFNNCIAAIAGSASLILHQDINAVRPHAQRIVAATINARSLVQKMLKLGSRSRTQEQFNVGNTVADVGEVLRPGLSMSQRLNIELPPEPIVAHGDATELMQIVLNLGINARDALGGAPGRITVSLSIWEPPSKAGTLVIGTLPDRRAALIRVTDDGSGMANDDIPRIFKRYYSSKPKNGSGLGLAIVARLVTMVGGGIAVSTKLGAGTTFEILWPLDQRSKPPLLTSRFARPDPQHPLAGFSILVAEDNPLTLATLSKILEEAGAEVGPCERPEDALEALRSDPDSWALLVTDYDMPEMTGAELAAAAGRVRPDLPVLLCTAMPEAALPHQDMFTAIIDKPMIGSVLVAAAAAALARGSS
jgi:PAS domain S-box-containing protein